MIFFNFLNFFAISYEFPITHRVGTKRNNNFYFPFFSVYSNILQLEMKPEWYCYIFGIFFYFFFNFLLCDRQERNGATIFVFRLSRPFSTYFWLEMKPPWYFLIFSYFFGIFNYSSGWNGTERQFLFSPFLSVSPLSLA